MQMEGRPDVELASILDKYAGIDGWHLHKLGLRGIAARVQAGVNYKTFTIRHTRRSGATTEYEKRKTAIGSPSGWIFPAITVQAYTKTKDGPVVSIGVAYTVDIFDFIEKGLNTENQCSNATFLVCNWKKMQANGYRVKVIEGA